MQQVLTSYLIPNIYTPFDLMKSINLGSLGINGLITLGSQVRYLSFTLLFLVLSLRGHAASIPPAFKFITSNDLFVTLDQRHGLGQPAILSMVQDELGYTWVGTQAGLNRYDGYQFKQFSNKQPDFSLLAGNYITALCISGPHQLWIGTRSGISRYNYRTGVLSSFTKEANKLPSNKISELSCQKNKVVVGTFNQGFFALNPKTGDVLKHSISPPLKVQSVTQTAHATFAATTTGLFKQSHQTHVIEQLTSDDSTSIAVFENWLFVSHEDGSIARYDINDNFKAPQWKNAITVGQLKRINQLEIQQGYLWASSKTGLYKIDFNGYLIKHYQQKKQQMDALIDDNVLSLLAIGNDNLWAGTAYNGISHLNLKSSQFGHIDNNTFKNSSTFNEDFRDFLFDQSNRLWISTSRGVYISDGKSIKPASFYYPSLKQLDLLFVSSMIIHQGKILFASFGGGVIIYDFDTQKTRHLYTPAPNVTKNFTNLVLYKNELVVAANNQGIFKIEQDWSQLTPFFKPSQTLPSSFYNMIVIDDTLWISSTGDGVYKVHNNTLQNFSITNGSPTDIAYSLTPGPNGHIWIATDKGMVIIDSDLKLIKHITQEEGLANEAVWDAVDDKQGAMWIGTSGGLSKVEIDNYKVTNFGLLDGIQALEFNVGAAQLSPTGRVFIGGSNGLNQFSPRALIPNSTISQIVLTEITLLGNPISPIKDRKISALNAEYTSQINLDYKQDILSFKYTALDYSGQNLQYYYRVVGLFNEWITMNKESRQFNLMKLAPGDYIVEAYVKNANGIKSDTHQLRIHLAAPWWWNTLSKFIYLLTFMSLVYSYYRSRKRAYLQLEDTVFARTTQLSAKNKKLELAMNKLQQAQSSLLESEKMAALGSLVAGVAHEINTPLGVVKTAVSHNQDIVRELKTITENKQLTASALDEFLATSFEGYELILSNLERSIHLVSTFKQVAVDQSTEAIREINLLQYLNEVLIALRPLLRKKNVTINIAGDDDIKMMSYPGPLYQILSNLVNNSMIHGFEHQESGHISITLEQNDKCVSMVYCDNGQGIDSEIIDKIFEPFMTTKRNKGGSGLGMHIVYNLITQLFGGTIYCASPATGGIEFVITIPITDLKAHD